MSALSARHLLLLLPVRVVCHSGVCVGGPQTHSTLTHIHTLPMQALCSHCPAWHGLHTPTSPMLCGPVQLQLSPTYTLPGARSEWDTREAEKVLWWLQQCQQQACLEAACWLGSALPCMRVGMRHVRWVGYN